MLYEDKTLKDALLKIVNSRNSFSSEARATCAKAFYRIDELEKAWERIREQTQEAAKVAEYPDAGQ